MEFSAKRGHSVLARILTQVSLGDAAENAVGESRFGWEMGKSEVQRDRDLWIVGRR
jgi:hypothetical protein